MAMTVGEAGIFQDSAGDPWPAQVTADHGSNTYSIVAHVEGYWAAYGPSVLGQWTADPAAVPLGLGAPLPVVLASALYQAVLRPISITGSVDRAAGRSSGSRVGIAIDDIKPRPLVAPECCVAPRWLGVPSGNASQTNIPSSSSSDLV